jgi:hypothetical protein
MFTLKTHATGQPSPLISSRYKQPLTWALLLTLGLIFAIWGLFSEPPFNLIFWSLGGLSIIVLIVVLIRDLRSAPKIELSEVRRLIACRSCGVESEGPFESHDYVFKEIGTCPRCGGSLYVKALYSIDAKTPLKRQKAPEKSDAPISTKED